MNTPLGSCPCVPGLLPTTRLKTISRLSVPPHHTSPMAHVGSRHDVASQVVAPTDTLHNREVAQVSQSFQPSSVSLQRWR